jgi:hypothetical protein
LLSQLQGRRLNATKKDRMEATYAADSRLRLHVADLMPRLLVSCTPLPATILQGENQALALELHNIGARPMTSLCAITTHPYNIAFDMRRAVIVHADGATEPLGRYTATLQHSVLLLEREWRLAGHWC